MIPAIALPLAVTDGTIDAAFDDAVTVAADIPFDAVMVDAAIALPPTVLPTLNADVRIASRNGPILREATPQTIGAAASERGSNAGGTVPLPFAATVPLERSPKITGVAMNTASAPIKLQNLPPQTASAAIPAQPMKPESDGVTLPPKATVSVDPKPFVQAAVLPSMPPHASWPKGQPLAFPAPVARPQASATAATLDVPQQPDVQLAKNSTTAASQPPTTPPATILSKPSMPVPAADPPIRPAVPTSVVDPVVGAAAPSSAIDPVGKTAVSVLKPDTSPASSQFAPPPPKRFERKDTATAAPQSVSISLQANVDPKSQDPLPRSTGVAPVPVPLAGAEGSPAPRFGAEVKPAVRAAQPSPRASDTLKTLQPPVDPALPAPSSDPLLGAPTSLTSAPGTPPSPVVASAAAYMQHGQVAKLPFVDVVRPTPAGGLELRLSPEELGPVRIGFQTSDAGLIVNIMADRSDTLDLIRRHLDSLAADLRREGFGTLSFTFGEKSSGSEGRAQEKPAMMDRQNNAETPDQAEAPRSARYTSGRLDIKL